MYNVQLEEVMKKLELLYDEYVKVENELRKYNYIKNISPVKDQYLDVAHKCALSLEEVRNILEEKVFKLSNGMYIYCTDTDIICTEEYVEE